MKLSFAFNAYSNSRNGMVYIDDTWMLKKNVDVMWM